VPEIVVSTERPKRTTPVQVSHGCERTAPPTAGPIPRDVAAGGHEVEHSGAPKRAPAHGHVALHAVARERPRDEEGKSALAPLVFLAGADYPAGFQAARTDVQALGSAAHQRPDPLDVGIPAAVGELVRVRDPMTEPRPTTTDVANSSHDSKMVAGASGSPDQRASRPLMSVGFTRLSGRRVPAVPVPHGIAVRPDGRTARCCPA
jgi:hypothetical protein